MDKKWYDSMMTYWIVLLAISLGAAGTAYVLWLKEAM
jgi:hypothetical protein